MGDFGLDTISNVRALSPVDFDQLANNQSLFASDPFPSVCGGQIMQDDTLLEKPASKQQSPKQLPVSIGQGNSTSEQNGDIVTNTVNGGLSEEKKNDMSLSSVTQLSIGLSEPSTTVVTSLSSAPNFWSTASADDTFVHGFQSLNGTVTFQQFPPAPNSVMNASFTGQHMSMNVPPPQRRAITAHHNFPQRQSPNVMLNNAKSYPNWSNAPQTSWSSQQNPATLSPWGNVQPNHQRRSVPNINALAPMKRATNFPQIPQSSFIAPSKFRRSTSFPGQIQQAALGMKPQFEYQAYDDLHRDGMNSVVFNQVRVCVIHQQNWSIYQMDTHSQFICVHYWMFFVEYVSVVFTFTVLCQVTSIWPRFLVLGHLFHHPSICPRVAVFMASFLVIYACVLLQPSPMSMFHVSTSNSR